MILNWEKLGIKHIAGIVAEHMAKHDIDATLVGGACVSIYSHNKYLSYDLDFVTDANMKELESALSEIGYKRIAGRLFKRPDSEFILDFVPYPIAVGQEPVHKKARIGMLRLLTPTDCVKDRLAAYYHWNDHQSLEQAIMVTKAQISKINPDCAIGIGIRRKIASFFRLKSCLHSCGYARTFLVRKNLALLRLGSRFLLHNLG